MKAIILLFSLLISGSSYAQNCVIEGAWMGIGPGLPGQCCPGLELMPPPAGQYGSRGQCLKKENGRFCIGENLSGLNYPGAVDQCCRGLTKVSPSIPDPRIRFVCVNVPTCVPENEYMSQNPAYQRPCCEGLRPEVVNDGRIGAGPKCVKVTPSCVKENEQISLNPAYAKPCCEGLEPVYINDGRVGHGRTCVKREQTECVREGVPLFQYPGAPSCCPGLTGRNPSPNSPVGFAQVCARGNDSSRINNSEERKEMISNDLIIGIPDPVDVSNQ